MKPYCQRIIVCKEKRYFCDYKYTNCNKPKGNGICHENEGDLSKDILNLHKQLFVICKINKFLKKHKRRTTTSVFLTVNTNCEIMPTNTKKKKTNNQNETIKNI